MPRLQQEKRVFLFILANSPLFIRDWREFADVNGKAIWENYSEQYMIFTKIMVK